MIPNVALMIDRDGGSPDIVPTLLASASASCSFYLEEASRIDRTLQHYEISMSSFEEKLGPRASPACGTVLRSTLSLVRKCSAEVISSKSQFCWYSDRLGSRRKWGFEL